MIGFISYDYESIKNETLSVLIRIILSKVSSSIIDSLNTAVLKRIVFIIFNDYYAKLCFQSFLITNLPALHEYAPTVL